MNTGIYTNALEPFAVVQDLSAEKLAKVRSAAIEIFHSGKPNVPVSQMDVLMRHGGDAWAKENVEPAAGILAGWISYHDNVSFSDEELQPSEDSLHPEDALDVLRILLSEAAQVNERVSDLRHRFKAWLAANPEYAEAVRDWNEAGRVALAKIASEEEDYFRYLFAEGNENGKRMAVEYFERRGLPLPEDGAR